MKKKKRRLKGWVADVLVVSLFAIELWMVMVVAAMF